MCSSISVVIVNNMTVGVRRRSPIVINNVKMEEKVLLGNAFRPFKILFVSDGLVPLQPLKFHASHAVRTPQAKIVWVFEIRTNITISLFHQQNPVNSTQR